VVMCCSLVSHTVPLASAMYCVVIGFESVTSATEAAAGTKRTAADKGHITLTLMSMCQQQDVVSRPFNVLCTY
jgi:hypothetical protein